MSAKLEIVWGNIHDPSKGYGGSRWTVVHDINGDGLDDLLAFGAVYPGEGPGAAPFRVYLQKADGSFTASNPMLDGSDLLTTHPRSYLFEDFNGDGINDIFIGAHGYDVSPFPGEQNRLLLGAGAGKFVDGTSKLPAITDFTHGVSAADIDHDGDLDIFVSNIYGQGVIAPYFLLNDGAGNFTRDDSRVPASVVNGVKTENVFTDARLVDLDNDGIPDLILGGASIPSRVYWGQPGGFYSDAAVTYLPDHATPIGIVHQSITYDFDRDGRLDVLLVGVEDMFLAGSVQLLINDGGRGYIDKTMEFFSEATAQSEFYAMRLQDINDDGWLDIVRATDTMTPDRPADILFWLNDGKNHFTAFTLGDAEVSELVQGAYVATDGAIRWLSAYGVGDGGGFANYYVPTDKFFAMLPEVPPVYLNGQNDGLYNVARFYNKQTGTHFYTANPEERDGLRAGGNGFVFEGNAFDTNASVADGIAVYRFFNIATGTHFYTANAAERDDVIASLPEMYDEGIAYYAYAADNGARQALHRFYNTQTGTHFYTANDAEQQQVAATLPAFSYEGIAYYVDIA